MSRNSVGVIGLGEVGRPLLTILQQSYECFGVDIAPVETPSICSVLHICYPFSIPDFIGTTIQYIFRLRPETLIINSTVAPGTTRMIQERTPDVGVVFSPVRGKHARMEADMLRYKKFVAGSQPAAVHRALKHFEAAGFDTDLFRTPELAELSKLLETTYLGVLVAWAQEVERLAQCYGGSFDEINAFIREIPFLPSHIYPGVIGGHCVMPNIAILRSTMQSDFLNLIDSSNRRKTDDVQRDSSYMQRGGV